MERGLLSIVLLMAHPAVFTVICGYLATQKPSLGQVPSLGLTQFSSVECVCVEEKELCLYFRAREWR